MNYELLKKKITTSLTLNCKVGEYYNAKKGKKMNFYIAPDNLEILIPTINTIIDENKSLSVIKESIGNLPAIIDFKKAKGFHFSSKIKDKQITVKDVIDLDKIIASCNDVKIIKKNNTTKKVVDNRYYCLYLSETNTGGKDIVFMKVGKFPTVYVANEDVIVKKIIVIPRKEFKTHDLLKDHIKKIYKENGIDVKTVVILNNKKVTKEDNNTKKETRRKITNKPAETLSKEQSLKTNDNKTKPKWNILYIFDSNRNAMVYYGTKNFSIKGKGTLKTLPIAFTEEEVLRYIEDYLKENKIVRKIIKNMDKEK